ncbi:hypothetical protein ACLOJK_031742 [Asimina triloba]
MTWRVTGSPPSFPSQMVLCLSQNSRASSYPKISLSSPLSLSLSTDLEILLRQNHLSVSLCISFLRFESISSVGVAFPTSLSRFLHTTAL